MRQVDVNNFLHSFAVWLSAQVRAVGLPMEYAKTPRGLWRNYVVENDAADPYTVLRVFGGPSSSTILRPTVAVQVMTNGTNHEVALNTIQTLFDALHDNSGKNLPATNIPGWKTTGEPGGDWQIVSCTDQGRPGLVSTDARGRPSYAFSIELGFKKLR